MTAIHKKVLLLGVSCILAISGSAQADRPATAGNPNASASSAAAGEDPEDKPQRFAAGRILVQPYPGVSEAHFEQIARNEGAKGLRRLSESLPVYIMEVPPGSERSIAARLAHNPRFQFAEVDEMVPPNQVVTTPSDPYYGQEWHLQKIQAPTAWSATQGSGVTVAILDTGVDGTHPDLAASMVAGYNFYDNNTNTADVWGHGTAVAGTVAGIYNNGIGVVGVAPGVRIMPIRISDTAGVGYWSMIASGLTWAADHGARIANNSYATTGSSAVQSAAQYFYNKGGAVFISAGNDSADPGIANNPYIVTVAATGRDDVRTSWSNYGACVDITAPGIDIYTTTRGGGYSWWWGTSFSSPVTAGVGALVKAANPALTASQIVNVMTSTADDLGTAGYDVYYGAGRVNAARAVAMAQSIVVDTTPPTVSLTDPASGATVTGMVVISATASDNVGVSRVEFYVNNVLLSTSQAAPYQATWDTTRASNGTATLTAYAYDTSGNRSQVATASVTVSNPVPQDTTPPTARITSPANGAVVSGATTKILGTASDNVGVTQLIVNVDGKDICTAANANSISCSWNTKKAARGSHTLTLIARDAAGNVGGNSIAVTK